MCYLSLRKTPALSTSKCREQNQKTSLRTQALLCHKLIVFFLCVHFVLFKPDITTHAYNNWRGRGRRVSMISRPVCIAE